MNDYYKQTLNTIANSINSISPSEYEQLLCSIETILKNGGKVIASGLGKNVPICEKFVGTLTSFGIPTVFLHTNSAMHGDLGYVSDKDILILLSKSGNTKESIDMARYLKCIGKKTDTWLLTFGKNTKVGEWTKHTIEMELETEGDPWNIAPNNSTTIYLILLQGIAIEIAKRLNVSLNDFKLNHPGGAIGETLSCKK